LYDKYYKEQPWPRFLWERERIVLQHCLDDFFSEREIHLLDFACGTGRIANFLEERVTTSVGVDVSESMLDVARGKLKHTELIQADLTENNVLRGRRFNLITSFRFFLNAEPELRAAALNALVPLLADDGYLVLNIHGNLSSPIVFAASIYHRLRGDNMNFMSLSHLRQIVADAGLEIVTVYPVGVLSIPRFTLPLSWNKRSDDFALRHPSLSFFSQSPIIVCRLRSAQPAEGR
jgi:predicted TPR repeat methyltransferase